MPLRPTFFLALCGLFSVVLAASSAAQEPSRASGEQKTQGGECAVEVYNVICRAYNVVPKAVELTPDNREKGVSLATLQGWFRESNLEAEGFRYSSVSEIPEEGAALVAHLSPNHYVVVTGRLGDKVAVIDSPYPQNLISGADFRRDWDGVVLKVTARNVIPAFPSIALDRKTVDLGRLSLREGAVVKLGVWNLSRNKELKIESVTVSCGCLVSELQSETIRPQESMSIPVTFNGKSMVGPIVEKLAIASADSLQPITMVEVNGAALAKNEFLPALVNFGRISSSSEVHANVRFLSDRFFSETKAVEITLNEGTRKAMEIRGKVSGEVLTLTATCGLNEKVEGITPRGFVKSTLNVTRLDSRGAPIGSSVSIPFCAKLPVTP